MHQKTIRVPVFVTFSTDPAELDDREGEMPPTKESLLAYLKDALRLDVDTEGNGQPEGAVFAAAGVDWDAAELVDDTAKPELYIAVFRHEYGVDVFTFYFVPDDKLKYPSPDRVAEHFKIDLEPGKGETFELARAYGPRMETLTASQVGSETLGPADWTHESEEDCLDEDTEDDTESNVPCVACGRKDLPLHTSGRCMACHPIDPPAGPLTPTTMSPASEFRLPCYGITIRLDREPTSEKPGSGMLTSDLRLKIMDSAADDVKYIAALDGLESLILAHACAGIDVASPAYIEGIETAVDAISSHRGQ
jgi:hypothetical protein